LRQYALEFFPAATRLTDLTGAHVARYVGWLYEPDRGLSDKSVRNYVGPLSACLESAKEEGLLRHNPVRESDSRTARRSRRMGRTFAHSPGSSWPPSSRSSTRAATGRM
jgi:hypothetical protein